MFDADEPGLPRAWVVGAGLMLVLMTAAPAAQAAQLVTAGWPCVTTGSGGAGVGECNYGGSTAVNGLLSGDHPTASGSSVFPSTGATAVGNDARMMWSLGDDVRVEWTFDESQVEANVTAFHVSQGLEPSLPSTMHHVGTVGPDTDQVYDEGGMTSGALWYVVTAELSDGSTVDSQPFRVSGTTLG